MLSAPGNPAPVLAAGALVWREKKGRIDVLLVHRPRYDDWSIPKGKLDKGETFPAAAVREVAEETGRRVRLQRPLPASVYLLPDGRTKIVQYWTATVRARSGPGPRNPREIDEVRWVRLEDAGSLMTRQVDHVQIDALARFLAAEELSTVPLIIQRHGAALSRSKWSKGEGTRPLSKKGVRQAKALPPVIDAFDPDRVITSPWKRCHATIAPFAKLGGMDVVEKAELTEDGHTEHPMRTAAVVDRVLGEGIGTVVCTHRPVLPTVVASARERAAPDIAMELPKSDPYLAAGEALILHAAADARIVAIERHLPNIG